LSFIAYDSSDNRGGPGMYRGDDAPKPEPERKPSMKFGQIFQVEAGSEKQPS
jgi:hypothetical protein